MLSTETINALGEALDAVIEQAGDDPQYADLIESLQSAQAALANLDGAEGAEPRDGDDDDYSFETAERRMAQRRRRGATDRDDA